MHEQNHKLRVGFDFMCNKSSQEKGLEMSPIRKYFIYHSQIFSTYLHDLYDFIIIQCQIYMQLSGFRNSAAYTSTVFPTFRQNYSSSFKGDENMGIIW